MKIHESCNFLKIGKNPWKYMTTNQFVKYLETASHLFFQNSLFHLNKFLIIKYLKSIIART
jgi:hypothetical protein